MQSFYYYDATINTFRAIGRPIGTDVLLLADRKTQGIKCAIRCQLRHPRILALMFRLAVFLSFLILRVSCYNPEVTISNGTLHGLAIPSMGQEAFLNIPYAQSIAGENVRTRPFHIFLSVAPTM